MRKIFAYLTIMYQLLADEIADYCYVDDKPNISDFVASSISEDANRVFSNTGHTMIYYKKHIDQSLPAEWDSGRTIKIRAKERSEGSDKPDGYGLRTRELYVYDVYGHKIRTK